MCSGGSNLFHHWSLLSRREEAQPTSTSLPSSRLLWSWTAAAASGGNKSAADSSGLEAAGSHSQLSTLIQRVSFTTLHLVHFLPRTQQPKRRLIWSLLFLLRLPLSAWQDDEGWHFKTQVSFPVCHMIPLFLSLQNRGSNNKYIYIYFCTVEKWHHHGNNHRKIASNWL